jgi:hypothetical protein
VLTYGSLSHNNEALYVPFSNDTAVIYVIGCYPHLFDITNVDIMYAITKPRGYILIYDSVPYLYTDYFTSKFEKLNDTTYVKI